MFFAHADTCVILEYYILNSNSLKMPVITPFWLNIMQFSVSVCFFQYLLNHIQIKENLKFSIGTDVGIFERTDVEE